jgi:outer membrane protein TolC
MKLTSTTHNKCILLLSIGMWLSFSFVSVKAQTKEFKLPNPPTKLDLSADSLIEQAFKKSAILKVQLNEVADKQEVINREKLGWLSSFKMGVQFLSVSQDYNAQTTTVGVLPSLGISLQIDFERLFTTPSNIRSAKLQKSNAKLAFESESEAIAIKIQELLFDMELAIKQSEIRYQTFFTIADQLTIIEERFKRGEIEMSVYLNALNAIDDAKESYLIVYYDVLKKKASLELLTQKGDSK